MPYCLNPQCQKPNNPETGRFCMNCGKNLQLKGLYEAIALIGQGGMGRTFRGRDLGRLGQPCAIKQFLPQFADSQLPDSKLMTKAIALFESEANQLKELGSHPQIPELIAYFEEDGCWYLVQELIEGENLYNELQRQGVFSEAKIYQLLAEILPVLQFIHDRQVIHRDIKPDNIIRKKGKRKKGKMSLVLVDFGAAKVFKSNTARTGTLIGSAEYIAPEQTRGKAVIQSDLYSLGVTCIHLLTGISPFDLYDDASDRWIWREKLPNAISTQLAKMVDQLLAKAIVNRYQSAEEVLKDLQPLKITNITSSANMALRSKGLRELREALSLGQWQEGDRLTNQIILELAKKTQISQLTTVDIQQIPCDLWLEIDRAWMEASNGHFGWTSQRQIWDSLGGKLIYRENNYWEFAVVYERFADRVGWRKPRWFKLAFSPKVWRKYENLTFTIASPQGHLPTLFFWEGFNLVDAVFYRLEICQTY
ncbi:GUN4 domain-containing protein [Pseudanabaena sp. FACHB-1998]|uniref:serine/threonine-protein kinase n=1 Tax=Pseudanabaena sp. FACHB-1998 TaxID=2692858 RepID=UPI0016819528|nr:serine/threonine-protein kinase [Pseudanabaena sp. FACHB-1998]MBD2178492.1 GUN4 domain-containing protein [Pseudanabaena sp. FACHB-1998]